MIGLDDSGIMQHGRAEHDRVAEHGRPTQRQGDLEINCRICGAPMVAGEDDYVLRYYLLRGVYGNGARGLTVKKNRMIGPNRASPPGH